MAVSLSTLGASLVGERTDRSLLHTCEKRFSLCKTKMKNLISLASLLFVIYQSHFTSSSPTIKGPPTAEKNELLQVVRLGGDVRLHCPLIGHPAPIINWSKDKESITEYGWTRFRPSRKSLKISKVTMDDRGTYFCKGINGFGSETVKIDLIVIDPSDFPNLKEGELPDVSLPKWTSETENTPSKFHLSMEDLEISCGASGKPLPKVTWYYYRRNGDDITIIPSQKFQDKHAREAVLSISVHSMSVSGVYSCVAENIIGRIVRNFSVAVDRNNEDISDMMAPSEPENTTVEEGDTAFLKCRVKSHGFIEPNVKWLKRMEAWEHSQKASDIIEVLKKKYRIIRNPNSENVPTINPGEYVNRLVIPNATQSDAGMYFCFVTNLRDYKFISNYLTVIPRSITSSTAGVEQEPVLILVICLAVFVFLLLISITTCVVVKKKQKNTMTSVESPDSPNLQENLMHQHLQQQRQSQICQQDSNGHPHHPHIVKMDQPLPVPPQPNYYSGGAESFASSKMYNENYYPPPPPSVASQQNQYEVPHAHQRYIYGQTYSNSATSGGGGGFGGGGGGGMAPITDQHQNMVYSAAAAYNQQAMY